MNILLTGPTGFIGQRLTRVLASRGHRLFLLVRPGSLSKAKKIFSDLTDLTYIEGDVEDTDVVKNIYTISTIIDEIDTVVHLAAYYNLEASQDEAYLKNVVGTQNMLYLLGKMKGLKNFHYFSTYAVNPVAQGAVNEDFLIGDDLPFHDHYSRTKNQAEHLVRNFKLPGLKKIILRPGIVIGDSETGEMDKTDGPYYFYDFILKLKKFDLVNKRLPFIPMPMQSHSFLPVLPVNTLAQWCAEIISHPPVHDFRCYHLMPHPLIKTKDFLEASLEHLGLPLKILALSQTKLLQPLLPLLNIPKQASFYMNQQTIFDRSHLLQDYPHLESPAYQQYLPNIIRGYLKGKM